MIYFRPECRERGIGHNHWGPLHGRVGCGRIENQNSEIRSWIEPHWSNYGKVVKVLNFFWVFSPALNSSPGKTLELLHSVGYFLRLHGVCLALSMELTSLQQAVQRRRLNPVCSSTPAVNRSTGHTECMALSEVCMN